MSQLVATRQNSTGHSAGSVGLNGCESSRELGGGLGEPDKCTRDGRTNRERLIDGEPRIAANDSERASRSPARVLPLA